MSTTLDTGRFHTLLAPLDGPNPCGADVRHEPEFDALKATRRVADAKGVALVEDMRQAAERKGAPASLATFVGVPSTVGEWASAEQQASAILTNQSKDLQVAVWLTEALAHQHGFDGAAAGLMIVRCLLEQYWDTLYPAADPQEHDPFDFRRSTLEWIDDLVPKVLKTTPLVGAGLNFGQIHFDVAETRGGLEGWPSLDELQAAVMASPADERNRCVASIKACAAELQSLDTAANSFFNGGVSFGTLSRLLEDCERILAFDAAESASGSSAHTLSPTSSPAVPLATVNLDVDGVWEKALQLVATGQLEGLRLAQDQIDRSRSGRERFLRQLTLAELCMQAGVHSLAFPLFDELGRTIDDRRLDEWEEPALIHRIWKGLAASCERLVKSRPELGTRYQEAVSRSERRPA